MESYNCHDPSINIYKLYKQVFSNIVISKQIFKFVKFEDGVEDGKGRIINYSLYEKEMKSYKLEELTIERLLSFKMYRLFDYLFEFYFSKVISYNQYSEKYIKLSNVIKLNTIRDLIELLSYKELGYNRFILFYQSNIDIFKTNKKCVLKLAAIGGNWEIYQFLSSQDGGQLFKKEFELQLRKNNISNENLNCGNNELIFQELIKFKINYEQGNVVKRPKNLEHFLFLLSSAISSNNRVLVKYLVIDRPYRIVGCEPSDYIGSLIGLSLVFSDLELAELITETPDLINNFNGEYTKITIPSQIYNRSPKKRSNIKEVYQGPVDLTASFSTVDFKILKYYWDYGEKGNNNKCKKFNSSWNLINFNFKSIDWDIPLIESLFSTYPSYYLPSFEEFQFIIVNNINIKNFDWCGLIDSITTKSFDLNYLKFVLDYIKKDEVLNDKIVLNPSCFDTKSQILQFLFNNKNNYKSIQFARFNDISFSKFGCNLFFNDYLSVQLFLNCIGSLSRSDWMIKSINATTDKWISQLIHSAINQNNYKMVKYLLKIAPSTINLSKVYDSIDNKKNLDSNNSLDILRIFKLLLDYSKIKNNPFFWSTHFEELFHDMFLRYNPMIHQYILSNEIMSIDFFNRSYFHKSELENLYLLKQYIRLNNSKIQRNYNLYITGLFRRDSTKISILNYLVHQCNIKPSTLLKDDRQNNLMISYLLNFGKMSNRLCYFIENDYNFIKRNIMKIILSCCKTKRIDYLNLILSNENYDNEFKQLLKIQFIYNSTSILNKKKSIDNDNLWHINLKNINDETINSFQNLKNKLVIYSDSQISTFQKNYNTVILRRNQEIQLINPSIYNIYSLLLYHLNPTSKINDEILDNIPINFKIN